MNFYKSLNKTPTICLALSNLHGYLPRLQGYCLSLGAFERHHYFCQKLRKHPAYPAVGSAKYTYFNLILQTLISKIIKKPFRGRLNSIMIGRLFLCPVKNFTPEYSSAVGSNLVGSWQLGQSLDFQQVGKLSNGQVIRAQCTSRLP